jgi:ADP-ribosylglycohydrolase
MGDSFGYVLRGKDDDAIRSRYGAPGLLDLSQAGKSVHFSSATQLTLYTVDALVEALEWANAGVAADEAACLWLAYLRWLATQQPPPEHAPPAQPRWIDAQSVLHHRRYPGAACIRALAGGTMGTVGRPLNPEAKGAGAVMRSAPFGLIPYISADSAYTMSINGAALTHGHPAARQSAAAFSILVRALMDGADPAGAAAAALDRARLHSAPSPELEDSLGTALDASRRTAVRGTELTSLFGSGALGTGALGIGVYAVLATAGAASPVEHFLSAIRLAANHGGASACTAAVAGNILGAYYGEACLPLGWLSLMEAPGLIRAIGDSLLKVTSGS